MAGSAARAGSAPVAVEGIGALADRFDGFILDQWGVLHDGGTPYPGVRACLERLAQRGKKVVVLSNSAKPAAASARRLAAMGIAPPLYAAVVTSGETTRRLLRERQDPFFARLGRRCHFVSADGDRSLLEGLDFVYAARPEDADFVLLAGLDWQAGPPVEGYDSLLAAARALDLPMVCPNPDRVGVSPRGLTPAPGAVAERYAALGGAVRFIGKPYPEVYVDCLAALVAMRRERILAVGDSLQHDIAGAAAAGLSTALVTGGIHAEELAADAGERLAELCGTWGATPCWVLPDLRW